MKFKWRLAMVITVLLLAVIYSLKRRFYRRQSVALEKYLEDNKDRGHILDDDLDAKILDSLDANAVNCNSSILRWTGISYRPESALVEPVCSYFSNTTTVFFIYSNLTNPEQRELIRLTFGRPEMKAKYKFKLIFVVGMGDSPRNKIEDEMDEVSIQREQMVYQDILQVRTSDISENEGIKALETLIWILKCATSVVNIVKVGDNTVPNLPLLFNDLNSRSYDAAHKELFCQLETGQMIEDKHKNITFEDPTSHQRTPIKIYTPFCRKSLIVFSRFIAKQLLKAAADKPVFKLEDVYLTGLLRETSCIPVPRRRMRAMKIVKNHSYNIGVYHFITFRKVNREAFIKTYESSLILEKLIA